MEFGDRSRFSIAIELDSDHGGVWLFGRICYWIAGAMVGQYDVGTSLRDVLFQMSPILGDRGRRYCPALFRLDKEEIFALVSAVLDETSEDLYHYTSADLLPARLDVRIPVDVFDSWKIFLVEGDSEAKLLYQTIESAAVEETVLGAGEFDIVFDKAYAYLEHLYEDEVAGRAG